MEKSQKKILFVAYHFPPSRAIGGKRIAAFARYLQHFGWKTYVVTVKDQEVEQKDENGLHYLERVDIEKAGKTPSLRDIYLRCKSLRKKTATKAQAAAGAANPVAAGTGIKDRLKHFLASMIFLPDEHSNWIVPAALRASSVIRRQGITHMLTSCPPYSTHLVGLLVKLRHPEIRWIADFRDPWMVPGEKMIYPTTVFSNRIEYALEKKVIAGSDLVVTTTANLARRLAEYYQNIDSERFVTIANGYEPDALPAAGGPKYQKFTISYTGSLYFGRTPEQLFAAVAALIADGELASDAIKIKLAGHCAMIGNRPTAEVAADYNLENIVEVIASVPQKESLEIIQKSHVALLLAPGQPFQIPGKTYEYIGLGTPILALTEEGATADLLAGTTAGAAVHPADTAAIKDFIRKTLRAQGTGAPSLQEEALSFSREKTVAELARFIEAID